jgi:hypothetical protein
LSVSSVATLLPEAVLFREEQHFDWRVYSVLGFLEAATGLGLARGHLWSGDFVLGLVIGLVLLMLVIVLLLYMTTEVTPTDLRVWFGWIPTYRRQLPIGTIIRIEVVTYRPIAEFGCWGISSGRDGERALIARGNRGVRLVLADGTKLLIGSQRPEALARALEQALQPGV